MDIPPEITVFTSRKLTVPERLDCRAWKPPPMNTFPELAQRQVRQTARRPARRRFMSHPRKASESVHPLGRRSAPAVLLDEFHKLVAGQRVMLLEERGHSFQSVARIGNVRHFGGALLGLRLGLICGAGDATCQADQKFFELRLVGLEYFGKGDSHS